MKKVLMVSSVISMIGEFNIDNIKILNKMGYKVEVLANCEGENVSKKTLEGYKLLFNELNVSVHNCPIKRNPFSLKNINAYRIMKHIIEEENYELIHCHSPVGGVLGRLAARKARKKGTKVIYTCHGFQFFRGGRIKDWLLFYPIEMIMSFFTDLIITINEMDYKVSKKFHSKKIEKIPGVGVNTKDFYKKTTIKRKQLTGLSDNAFILISVGEINIKKNQQVVIKAIGNTRKENIHYLICGIGPEKQNLEELSRELGIEKQIHFLGYRNNIIDFLSVSDVFVFPSRGEGLGLAAIEAMSVGLPLLTSNVHGINDYSKNGVTGYKFDPDDVSGFTNGILNLYKNPIDRKIIGNRNKIIAKKYDIKIVNEKMTAIYQMMLSD